MRRTFLIALCLLGCGDDDPIAPPTDFDAGQPDTSAPDASLPTINAPDASAPQQDAAMRDASAPFVCDVKAPTSCPTPAPTFADVQPIFVQQCGACHGKDWTGEWPLESYSHISDWQDEIRSELVTCMMPPPEGGVNISLEDRMMILTWIRCGLPR